MSTLTMTLPDGTSWVLTWDATACVAPPAVPVVVPSSMAAAAPATAGSPSLSQPVDPAPTQADVAAALSRVPPRWTATAWRFVKTLAAGMAAAFGVAWATTGGTIDGVARDPRTFLVALGTALLMALQKALTWKQG